MTGTHGAGVGNQLPLSAQDNPSLGCTTSSLSSDVKGKQQRSKRTNELLSMPSALAFFLSLEELFGLGEENTDDANGKQSSGTDPEKDLV